MKDVGSLDAGEGGLARGTGVLALAEWSLRLLPVSHLISAGSIVRTMHEGTPSCTQRHVEADTNAYLRLWPFEYWGDLPTRNKRTTREHEIASGQ